MKKILSIYNLFVVSVFLKGLDAVLEIIGGVASFFVNKTALNKIIAFLIRGELQEDPGDIVANYLVEFSRQYTSYIQTFIGVYLLVHGIIKIVLVYYLLKKRLFVYPIAIAVFSLFAIYQAYVFTIRPSLGLIALTVLDVFVIVLTSLEYGNLKKKNI